MSTAIVVASFAANISVGPILPPCQLLLNRAGHAIPIVLEYPIRLELLLQDS